MFVCSFLLRSWNLRQSFALKFLKWCVSQQLHIRKHSYWTIVTREGWHSLHDPDPMPLGGARGQNLGHLKKVLFLNFVMESPYVDT